MVAGLEALSGVSLALAIGFSLSRRGAKADFWSAAGFLMSEVTFLALGAGLRISHQFSDAASLFTYFTATLLIHLLLATPDRARSS